MIKMLTAKYIILYIYIFVSKKRIGFFAYHCHLGSFFVLIYYLNR